MSTIIHHRDADRPTLTVYGEPPAALAVYRYAQRRSRDAQPGESTWVGPRGHTTAHLIAHLIATGHTVLDIDGKGHPQRRPAPVSHSYPAYLGGDRRLDTAAATLAGYTTDGLRTAMVERFMAGINDVPRLAQLAQAAEHGDRRAEAALVQQELADTERMRSITQHWDVFRRDETTIPELLEAAEIAGRWSHSSALIQAEVDHLNHGIERQTRPTIPDGPPPIGIWKIDDALTEGHLREQQYRYPEYDEHQRAVAVLRDHRLHQLRSMAGRAAGP